MARLYIIRLARRPTFDAGLKHDQVKGNIVSHPHIAFDHYPRISHAAASPNNNKHLWIIARINSSFLFLNSVENVKDVDLEGITTYIKQGATFEPVPGPKIFSAC